MLTRFFIVITLLVVVATFVGCGNNSSLPGLNAPKTFTLYSIDGRLLPPGKETKTDEKFRGYPVLGKVEITDRAKQRELTNALETGIAKNDGGEANCFSPRHAIRVTTDGRTVDYVICFECLQVYVYDNESKSKKLITRDPQSIFDKQLQDAGITLAPK
jgi:hypothetical protein